MAFDLELHRIDQPFAGLRVSDPGRDARVAAAIARDGQQQPVLVVARDERFVLIDGHRRVQSAVRLGRDTVLAVVLDLDEASALAFAHRADTGRRRSALEDAWLVRELVDRYEMSQHAVARLLQRSTSWVSRRLGLLRQLPESIQEAVRSGRIGASAAEKYLVPLSRGNREHAERLVANLGDSRPNQRQLEALYAGWRRADAAGRERIVAEPLLFLATVDAGPAPALPDDDPATGIVRALEAVQGASGRARRQIRETDLHRVDDLGRAAVRRAFDEANTSVESVRRALAEEGLTCTTATSAPPS